LIDQGCRQALGSTERRLDLLLVDRVDLLSRKVRQRRPAEELDSSSSS
jgi:hypothetical protein